MRSSAKLVEKEAAMKTENGLAPHTLLFSKKGSQGSQGGKVSKSPKRDKSDDKRDDKRDNKDDTKEKNFQKCLHCQRQGHTTENCSSKQPGDPPKAADTTTKASAWAASTLTIWIKNYLMVASSNAFSSNWLIDCGVTTHISGGRLMFITFTEYPPNRKKVKQYSGVTLGVAGCRSVRLICQLPDAMTETIRLQEVVHSMGWFNPISVSQIMSQDVTVEPANHYGLSLYYLHGKLIATAAQVNGLYILDGAPDSTEYTDIDDSCLLAQTSTGHAYRYDTAKWMLWHHRLAHVCLQQMKIMPMIPNVPRMTGKCDCTSCIKCQLTRKLFTLTKTSRASEPLHLVHSDICGPLETAIRGGRYILLLVDDATRYTLDYILQYKLEALEKFQESKALREYN
jgi:hypothetical protein